MMKKRFLLPSKKFLIPVFFFLVFLSSSVTHSLETPKANSCFVYPSPASGDTAWVVYNMTFSGTALVLVYNETGDMVAQIQESKPAGIQQTGLDLFYYRKGIYLCRIIQTYDSGAVNRVKPFKFLVIR